MLIIILLLVPECYKTQEIYVRGVNTCFLYLILSDWNKTQKVYDQVVDNYHMH